MRDVKPQPNTIKQRSELKGSTKKASTVQKVPNQTNINVEELTENEKKSSSKDLGIEQLTEVQKRQPPGQIIPQNKFQSKRLHQTSEQSQQEVQKPVKRKKLNQFGDYQRLSESPRKSKKDELTLRSVNNQNLAQRLRETFDPDDTFLKCRCCFQCNFAPYEQEIFTTRSLRHNYTYVACVKCLKACHYGCLPDTLIGDLSTLQLQTTFGRDETVILYECEDCLQGDEAQECYACKQPSTGNLMTNGLIEGRTERLHQLCALFSARYTQEGLQIDEVSNRKCQLTQKEAFCVECAECKTLANPIEALKVQWTVSFDGQQFRMHCPQHKSSRHDKMCLFCSQQSDKDKCDSCLQTQELMEGFEGLILDHQHIPSLLTVDKRSFLKPLERTLPHTSYRQSNLHTKLWLLVQEMLVKEVTTDTILTKFNAQMQFTLPTTSLISKKVHELHLSDDLLGVRDVLLPSGSVDSDAVKNLQNLQERSKEIAQLQHYSDKLEPHWLAYCKRQHLLLCAQMLKKPQVDQASQLLEKLQCLGLQEMNTFEFIKTQVDLYHSWESKITSKFHRPLQSQSELEREVFLLKNLYADPGDCLQKRLIKLKAIFDKLAHHDVIEEQLRVPDHDICLFDREAFKTSILQTIAKLKMIVQEPDLPKEKPLQHLLKLLCYLASQPFQVDTSQLLHQYEKSVLWEIKVKQFLGKREIWEGQPYMGHDCHQLGEIPQDVIFDEGLWKLACFKSYYIDQLQRHCAEVLQTDDDVGVEELEKLIVQCKQFDLEWASLQAKVDLMQKVLELTTAQGGDQNYEDLLQKVMTEVYQAKMNRISIPQGLEAMLEGKVQIIEELRCEFNQILARCANFFNKQHTSDLKKILIKAKDHKLLMEKEKRIVESIPKSEDWFIPTFEKLKQLCGPQLHQIDFKDHLQLYSVIKTQKNCELLLRMPPNVKPEGLVAAARNLYQSLQGAKLIFEVRALMQGSEQTPGQQRELSHLLMLYYKAKELQINLNSPALDHEYILTDDDNPQQTLIEEFQNLALNAVEFDSLFGTHQKVIQTLERYEFKMPELLEIVHKIQTKLLSIKESTKCQISPAQELEVLQKVRSYISLNKDYQIFINKEGMEIDKKKISYQKALKLQRQARESQIPDDIPVMRRLNQSVLKFEKFRRELQDYNRFRERIKIKGYSFINSAAQIAFRDDKQDIQDSAYNLKFVKRLLDDAADLDIELPADSFDPVQLQGDLRTYDEWLQQTQLIMKKLEQELVRRSELSLQGDTVQQFQRIKREVSQCPVYNTELFMKIEAFDWVYNQCRLLNGVPIDNQDPSQILNLQYWQTYYDQQQQLQQTLPVLKGHPILQRILWEIDQARTITDFVRSCKNTQRSLSGKFVQMQKGTGADNYMLFKNKTQREKLDRVRDQAQRCKVDISSDMSDLESWAAQHTRYLQMASSGILWQQGYEKVKTIQRNVFQSPLDFGELYFDIEKRLEIAEEIRSDLKLVFEENQEKRIKLSRVRYTLEHFEQNCQIKGIPEVERIQKQIKVSQECLEKCEQLIETGTDITQIRQMIQTQIIVDLETDELPLRKEVFERTIKQLEDDLPYQQFKLLEKDYLKLKHQISKHGLEFTSLQFDLLRLHADQCLQSIKAGEPYTSDRINFDCVIADRAAQLYAQQKALQFNHLGTTLIVDDVEMVSGSEVSLSQSDTEMESSSVSKNSQDSSSSSEDDQAREAGEDEMSEMKGRKELSVEEASEESSDEECIAVNRERRQIKPNMMDDHIYFVKKQPQQQSESQKEIRQRRLAKLAAKQFERQKKKSQQKSAPKTEQPLDFQNFNLQDDDEISNSINQMKLRIRNQSRTQLSNCLQKHTCFGDVNKAEVQQQIRAVTLELEESIFKKFTMVDQQYRSKLAEVIRNLELLKTQQDISELYFVKKTAPLMKLLQSSLNFQEMFEKAVQQRKLDLRRQQRQQRPPESQSSQMLRQMYRPPGMLMPRPSVPMLPKPIEIHEDAKRKGSCDSIESLQSNPAQFSDDDYDPLQMKPLQSASFLFPPPGVNLPQLSYNPALSLIQYSQSQNQKEQILYDPVAHGAQPMQHQQVRVTLARPGSLLKVYDGSLDIRQKDSQFNLTLWSFQDVRLFQKVPQPKQELSLKGKLTLKEVFDHFIRVQQDPNAGQLLKGYGQRTSYLNGEQSERYQRFYDLLEQTQRAAVFNLLDGVSLYLIPICKTTKEFVQRLGVQTSSEHLSTSQSAKKYDFDPETHMFAWFSQIRHQFPVKSAQIWNPQVIKPLQHQESQQVAKSALQTSPITSEEPSFESQKPKTKVEINLIQAATPNIKAETIEYQQHNPKREENEEIDIDALIARYRNHGDTVDIEAMLQPIVHKLIGQGKQNLKLEAFLKEVIAKNQMLKQVKQEQHHQQQQQQYMPVYQQAYHQIPLYQTEQFQQQRTAAFQQQQFAPPMMQFPGIRPPMPMVGMNQYPPNQPQQQMPLQQQQQQHQYPGQEMPMYPGQLPMYRPVVRYPPPPNQSQYYPPPPHNQQGNQRR